MVNRVENKSVQEAQMLMEPSLTVGSMEEVGVGI